MVLQGFLVHKMVVNRNKKDSLIVSYKRHIVTAEPFSERFCIEPYTTHQSEETFHKAKNPYNAKGSLSVYDPFS